MLTTGLPIYYIQQILKTHVQDDMLEDLNLSQNTPLTQFNDLEYIVITNSNDIAPIKSATQNQSVTASLTTFIDSTQLLLDTNQFFGIKSPDLLSNYLIVTPTAINTYIY